MKVTPEEILGLVICGILALGVLFLTFCGGV